jgi:hypothetical protein
MFCTSLILIGALLGAGLALGARPPVSAYVPVRRRKRLQPIGN